MVFDVKLIVIPLIVPSVLVSLLFLIRKILFKLFHKWADNTKNRLDNIVIESIKTPSIYWILAIALYVTIGISEIPEKYALYIIRTLYVIIIFSVTLVIANMADRIFKHYVENMGIPFPTTGLTHGIIKGIILIIGFLIILGSLGISIAPLITALGIGGLAVALALQDTLSNLFAGIHILMEKPVRVGDFIKLETGQEGFVEDVGWRTTKVRMLPNNMVIIPNSKLSQSILTNYFLPEKRMSLLISIGVGYSSDPGEVERILVEEAQKGANDIPGLLADPEPFVRFIPGFGESSLDFTLICQVKEFIDQYLVQHELRKRIFKRFKEEGIEIPFPHRTVYLREENSWKR
jgi:small-conductance mechanosensitive channel